MTSHISDVKPLPHHARRDVCGSRPAYRQGRKATAVKVFTINQESCYLLISNVSAVGAGEDLRDACLEYGDIDDYHAVDGYDTEEFTETYLVKFARVQSARIAKKKLDETSFFGAVLHVCYAPEFETLDETRRKIIDRCKYIAFKTGQHFRPITVSRGRKRRSEAEGSHYVVPRKRTPDVPEAAPIPHIWAGQEYSWTPAQPSSSNQPVLPLPPSVNPLYNDEPLSFNDSPCQTSGDNRESLSREGKSSSAQLVTDAYERTITLIRDKVKRVAVPNTDVLIRKRKP